MSRDKAHSAYRTAETVKRLSDRVVGFGPFGIGLDGLLTWIPGAGLVYGVGAGGYLLLRAFQAGAAPLTLARMLGYLVVDTATSEVPIVGDAIDLLFPGHLLAATAMQKDIERRHGVPEGMESVLRRPRLRRTGLGWVALLVVILIGVAIWQSNFGELIHQGLIHALSHARLPLLGASIALPVILIVGMVMLTILSVVRRGLQRRGLGGAAAPL
ncbi:MAG: DUF4112 domain-containing protein [Pseudomonadota bacterium]